MQTIQTNTNLVFEALTFNMISISHENKFFAYINFYAKCIDNLSIIFSI